MFVAKDNQKTLLNDIRLWFHDDAKRPPDFAHMTGKPINGKLPTVHGRWEQREIWTTTALNDYLLFPGVGQAFLIRRTRCQVRKGRVTDTKASTPPAIVTSHTPHTAPIPKGCCASTAATGPSKTAQHRILDDSDRRLERATTAASASAMLTREHDWAAPLCHRRSDQNATANPSPTHRAASCADSAPHALLLDYLKMSANTRPKARHSA